MKRKVTQWLEDVQQIPKNFLTDLKTNVKQSVVDALTNFWNQIVRKYDEINFFFFWKAALFVHFLLYLWDLVVGHGKTLVAPAPSTTALHSREAEHSVRFVCLSDIHNSIDKLKGKIPAGDVLIISGDLTWGVKKDVEEGVKQLVNVNKFLGTLPHKHKILISGNHDGFMQSLTKEKIDKIFTNARYVNEELIEVAGVRIFGSPVSLSNGTISPNTAWQLPKSVESKSHYNQWRKKYNRGSIDVLITHGPPLGFCDKRWNLSKSGCKYLRQFVEEYKPRFHVFGHVHESYGVSRTSNTTFINACNTNMVNWIDRSHAPICFDFNFYPDLSPFN